MGRGPGRDVLELAGHLAGALGEVREGLGPQHEGGGDEDDRQLRDPCGGTRQPTQPRGKGKETSWASNPEIDIVRPPPAREKDHFFNTHIHGRQKGAIEMKAFVGEEIECIIT